MIFNNELKTIRTFWQPIWASLLFDTLHHPNQNNRLLITGHMMNHINRIFHAAHLLLAGFLLPEEPSLDVLPKLGTRKSHTSLCFNPINLDLLLRTAANTLPLLLG